jgi:Smg protein
MNETVLDVLMYLFENFSDQEYETAPDQVVLRDELLQAGFGELEVDRALAWLEELATTEAEPFASKPASRSVRIFSTNELARLDTECRGYLMYLEQIGILTASQREVVLERLMALDSRDIDVEQVKWVVLMVLFSQPGQETAFSRMEDLVFDDEIGALH